MMTDRSRIYLIGFMGSGKTTLGRMLARVLDYDFEDLDSMVTARAGKSIPEIFDEDGEESFRTLEREALRSTETFKNIIIATGGGTPCYFDNMQWMNTHGITLYLDFPKKVLLANLLPETSDRPLIAGKTPTELARYIDKKRAEREVFYLQARFRIEDPEITPEEVVSMIFNE